MAAGSLGRSHSARSSPRSDEATLLGISLKAPPPGERLLLLSRGLAAGSLDGDAASLRQLMDTPFVETAPVFGDQRFEFCLLGRRERSSRLSVEQLGQAQALLRSEVASGLFTFVDGRCPHLEEVIQPYSQHGRRRPGNLEIRPLYGLGIGQTIEGFRIDRQSEAPLDQPLKLRHA